MKIKPTFQILHNAWTKTEALLHTLKRLHSVCVCVVYVLYVGTEREKH